MSLFINNVAGLGLAESQGLYMSESLLMGPERQHALGATLSRSRCMPVPNMLQAGVYGDIMHYLKAVTAAGSDDGPKNFKSPVSSTSRAKTAGQIGLGRMNMNRLRVGLLAAMSALALPSIAWADTPAPTPVTSLQTAPVGPDGSGEPLVLAKQGSFFAGGSVVTASNGNTYHGDSTYVQFNIPVSPRQYPIVMWHGGGQSGKSWSSTPDGRDGFEQIFARRGFSTYVIDQARRGRAGRSILGTTIVGGTDPDADFFNEALRFTIFRMGLWVPPAPPKFFANTQSPVDQASIDQLSFQSVPDTGPNKADLATLEFQARNVVALFQKIGPGILLTHSFSGRNGWTTGILAPNLVRAIVAYEPSNFAFPSDDPPPDVPTDVSSVAMASASQLYTPAQFANLTKMPIQIIFGDNIDFDTPSSNYGVELWRVVVQRAAQFVAAVNNRGGHAEILFLPSAGLKGNTHFAFADKNNLAVANLLSSWLSSNQLDRRLNQ